MIVDAHQHFWSAPLDRYPWMTDKLAAIRRPFGPRDLAPLLKENHVDRTVVVQARMDLQETQELLALAAANDFVAGVVGWVDLTDPGVAATLGELRSGPNGSKLVGIRHQVHDEEDPNWLLRPDVQRGIAAVSEGDLAYDFLVRTRELPAAYETASRFPRMRFVIDHMAKPPIRSGDLDAWKQGIVKMAELSNVSCKLSGLVTEADWTHWTKEQLVPVITYVVEQFGWGRCIFGSDWPVCLLAASYSQVLELLRSGLRGVVRHPRDADAVLGPNAERVYRLARARR